MDYFFLIHLLVDTFTDIILIIKMNKILNKYIIILIFFYTFWLIGLPLIFSKTVPVVCENLSANTNYNIQITEPKLRLNVIPTAKISANKIEITEKKSNDKILLNNFEITTRIFPLLSGKIHINNITISNRLIGPQN